MNIFSYLRILWYAGPGVGDFEHRDQFIIVRGCLVQTCTLGPSPIGICVGSLNVHARYGASILGSTIIVSNSHVRSLLRRCLGNAEYPTSH